MDTQLNKGLGWLKEQLAEKKPEEKKPEEKKEDKPEEKKEGAALPLKSGRFFVDALLEWFAVQPGHAVRTL